MRRSERIVRITQTLLEHPNRVLSLTEMADRLSSAKSSLSEDLAIIREVFEQEGWGQLETQAGAAGGVRFIPDCSRVHAEDFVKEMASVLADPERILPGGYLYMSDILGKPEVLDMAGRMFASAFRKTGAEYVLTVETKGIPLAVSTSRYLQIPAIVIRRDHRVTEGSAVSINYVSGSRRIQTMSLSRRSLPERKKVLLIDDFMKAGGTLKAMTDLMREFHAEVVGVGVFMSTSEPTDKLVGNDYISLTTLDSVNENEREVKVIPGNYFEQ
jgi:purine operon repressor